MLFGQLITSSTNLFDTVEDTQHMVYWEERNNALVLAITFQMLVAIFEKVMCAICQGGRPQNTFAFLHYFSTDPQIRKLEAI